MAKQTNIDISSRVHRLEQSYFALGEFSDVYKCQLDSQSGSEKVAVKVIRGYSPNEDRRMKLRQEIGALVGTWQGFYHENIIHCFGISNDFGYLPGLVLPLCNEGTITKYARSQSSSRKLDVLLQVSSALKYLHFNKFVHTDVRGANILVHNGKPLLMDGGLAPLLNNGEFTVAGVSGRARWMAPELLDPPEELADCGASSCTFESDIYSLGMTILEVMTGDKPYCHRRYETSVILDVVRGVKPNRPEVPVVSDGVWSIIEACWERAENRPSAIMVEAWIDMLRYVDAGNIYP
ncbi:kinase-like domain-containing protein [Collybia nuda]|uniref:Kinase-like domain-containing protein n=1 Tax=Collybia nuda TaxID=64659 RepID=A0A9P5YAZ7_9AGAR|nr:kinase-like domain-containing protein [Collybia nuda]